MNDFVLMVIRDNGDIYKVLKNDKYHNHYQYLKDLSKENEYFRKCSFGLIFNIEEDSVIKFLTMLCKTGSIVLINDYTFNNTSCMNISLPSNITEKQKPIIENIYNQIDKFNYTFIEYFDNENNKFETLYKTSEDLENKLLLSNFVDTHLKIKK